MNFFNKTIINNLRDEVFKTYENQLNIVKEFIISCSTYKRISDEPHKKAIRKACEQLKNAINSVIHDTIKDDIKKINLFDNSTKTIKDDINVFVEDELGIRFLEHNFSNLELYDAIYKSDRDYENAKLDLSNMYRTQIIKTCLYNKIMEDRLFQIKSYYYDVFNLTLELDNKSITYNLIKALNESFDRFIHMLDSNMFPMNLITECASRLLRDLDVRLFYKRYAYYTELLTIFENIDYELLTNSLVLRLRSRVESDMIEKISSLETKLESQEQKINKILEILYQNSKNVSESETKYDEVD